MLVCPYIYELYMEKEYRKDIDIYEDNIYTLFEKHIAWKFIYKNSVKSEKLSSLSSV